MKKILFALLFVFSCLAGIAQQGIRIDVTALAAMDSAWISGGNFYYRINGQTRNLGPVGGTAPVSSVFGRTGPVTAQSGDYSAFYPLLSGSYSNPNWILDLPFSKINSRPTTLSGYGIVPDGADYGMFYAPQSRNINGFNLASDITLSTTHIGEGLNLYFTNTRARNAFSFVPGSGGYNSSTGQFSIPTNNNQLVNGANYVTADSLVDLMFDSTYDRLAIKKNDSTMLVKSIRLLAGSSKATVTKDINDSTNTYTVDVNEANLNLTQSQITGLVSALSGKQGNITYQDEGIAQGAAGVNTTINFTGAGVAATNSGSVLTVNIPGGGSGAVDGGGFPSFEAEFHNVNTVQSQFIGLAIGSGTNTTAVASTIATVDHPGVVLLRSSTTANSGYGYLTSSTSNNALFSLKGGEQYDFVFRTAAAFTNTTFRAGYPNTSSSTLPLDGIWMEFVGSGAMVGRTGNAGSYSTTATITTLSANTWYHGRVELSNDRATATFSVWAENGTLLGSLTLTTTIPGTDRQVRTGALVTNSGTTATDLIFIDWMRHKNNQKLQRGNF